MEEKLRKDILRKEIRKKRESLDQKEVLELSEKITQKVISLGEFEIAKTVLLYSSKGKEVFTKNLMQYALLEGKRLCLPVTLKEGLQIYEVDSLKELSPGAFGILEPLKLPEKLIEPEEIDFVLVPGIAFDKMGNRIGYGMGYYDSFLKKVRVPKVGLLFEVQLLDSVPYEKHDVPVDILISEKQIIYCNANRNPKPFKIVVLASGRGTDFQSIIDSKNNGELSLVEISALITDNPSAYAIERAKKAGIPYFVISYSNREELDLKIKKILDSISPDLVVLAGYMKIIKNKELLSSYFGKIINIHPSLLPKYPGVNAQKAAFEAKEKVSGYTIHFVDDTLDGGQIIYQEKVDISDCKTDDEVASKILAREHVGLPKVVGMFSRGKFKIENERVRYYTDP
jgi:phosphoribosylglycinamide formyltransferase-1